MHLSPLPATDFLAIVGFSIFLIFFEFSEIGIARGRITQCPPGSEIMPFPRLVKIHGIVCFHSVGPRLYRRGFAACDPVTLILGQCGRGDLRVFGSRMISVRMSPFSERLFQSTLCSVVLWLPRKLSHEQMSFELLARSILIYLSVRVAHVVPCMSNNTVQLRVRDGSATIEWQNRMANELWFLILAACRQSVEWTTHPQPVCS